MVTLAQPLSFNDQAELYRTENQVNYPSISPSTAKQNMLAASWEKFRRLCELFVVYDERTTQAITLTVARVIFSLAGMRVENQLIKIWAKHGIDEPIRFEVVLRKIQKTSFPDMENIPGPQYAQRNSLIRQTTAVNSLAPQLFDRLARKLVEDFAELNVGLLLFDASRTGYIQKNELLVALRAYNLHEGRANFIIFRSDRNGNGRIAWVEYLNNLKSADYASISFSQTIGPNPMKKHSAVVKAMTARSSSFYTESDGSNTNRSNATSVMSYMSNASHSSRTGNWPGHRSMTYSSPGSYRSQRANQLPELISPKQQVEGGTGISQTDLESLHLSNCSKPGGSSKSGRREHSVQYGQNTPRKNKQKFTFNRRGLEKTEHGELFNKLNNKFLQLDLGNGYIMQKEIVEVCTSLGMEDYYDVLSSCSSRCTDSRVSFVDFANELKQKLEPGFPVVYEGSPQRVGKRRGESRNFQQQQQQQQQLASGTSRMLPLPFSGKHRRNTKSNVFASVADELGRNDTNHGKFSKGEIRDTCQKFGISRSVVDRILVNCSKNKDGRVGHIDFANHLKLELNTSTNTNTNTIAIALALPVTLPLALALGVSEEVFQ